VSVGGILAVVVRWLHERVTGPPGWSSR
jgi:hypothetical protein